MQQIVLPILVFGFLIFKSISITVKSKTTTNVCTIVRMALIFKNVNIFSSIELLLSLNLRYRLIRENQQH